MGRPAIGDDAQILISGLHEDVAAAQVNFVGMGVAPHNQLATRQSSFR